MISSPQIFTQLPGRVTATISQFTLKFNQSSKVIFSPENISQFTGKVYIYVLEKILEIQENNKSAKGIGFSCLPITEVKGATAKIQNLSDKGCLGQAKIEQGKVTELYLHEEWVKMLKKKPDISEVIEINGDQYIKATEPISIKALSTEEYFAMTAQHLSIAQKV